MQIQAIPGGICRLLGSIDKKSGKELNWKSNIITFCRPEGCVGGKIADRLIDFQGNFNDAGCLYGYNNKTLPRQK
jgi:hypothetical protein